MSGIGFLLKETAARGIRLRAEPIEVEPPEDAYEIRSTVRNGHGVVLDDEGDLAMGKRDVGLMELFVPRLSGVVPNGRPCMWWTFERKIGEETIIKKSKGEFIEASVDVCALDWREAAGTLADSMLSMAWIYEAAVVGEAFAPRGAWLVCEDCDEAQLLPKNLGSPSSPRKCHMTPRCEGYARRVSLVVSVTTPKSRKPKVPKMDKGVKRTPGAERMRKKLGLVEVESMDIPVDTLNADDI